MADDFDDGKEALREAFKKEYQDLKSAINNVNTRTQLITVLANASSLFSKASELGIDLKMSELLESAEAKVKIYESEVTQDRNRQEIEEAAEQKRLEEALAEAQKVANEVREKELEEHLKDYKDFQDNFHKQLKADGDLLEQAAKDPNSLTAEQRAQLTGQYATDEERKAAKKKEQEMSRRCKVHYAIKNKAKESIAYRQGKIKENDTVINHPDTPEPVREQRCQENAVHKQQVGKHEESLALLNPAEQEIEKQRKQILALANSDQPTLAVEKLKAHHKNHGKDYEQERQQDMNHQGYNELHSMIMALGGHEKLGLPKPKYPIAEKEIPSPQNIKSLSAVERQEEVTKSSVHTEQTLREQAKAIRNSLEQQDKTKTQTMSKFSQRGKAMEGHGRS
jgi:hypothetical protein